MSHKAKQLKSQSAPFAGFLFTLPFLITNIVVSLRVEPFYSFLDSFPMMRNSPLTPLLLLLFFPVGAFVAIRPMLKKRTGEKTSMYIANITIASIIMIIFLVLFVAFGEELYRCDVLRIPNCD